jgi:FADH2-dependent halogenase
MDLERYDALIIGGGPGGSTSATFLARAGKRVLLLEKERFPRFHIGESLLPYNRRIFEEMGVLSSLAKAGFPVKKGAQFHLGNGSKALKFFFRDGRFTKEPEAFQVERARFDHLLLQHARESGADVREEWTVLKFESRENSALVQARDPQGNQHHFHASFLLDASGRSNLTGNQERLRVIHPHLKKVALFGHFTGVRLDPGEKAGDTVIVRLENKWFWLIPLSSEKVSVGCVMDRAELSEAKGNLADLFTRFWQSSPPLRERMEGAQLLGTFQTTSDFSYYNRRLVGPRLLRIGDAAGFMDPIFSAGVYLATYSGKLAAETVLASLERPYSAATRLTAYEKRVFRAMKLYWELVEHFYTAPFLDVFFAPREKFSIASAVNAVLAGEVEGGWSLRWRLRLFFQIVKLQSRWPFLPRISFEPERPDSGG